MTKETLPTEPMSSETNLAVPPNDDPALPTGSLTASGSGLQSTNIDNMFNRIRQTGLVRTQDRWISGVASGVARRMGWDPTLVRGLLFVSTFLTGLGLVLYGLGWALLPEESDGRIHLQEAIRGRFDPALVGAGLLFLAGLGRTSGGVGSALGHSFAVVSGIVTTALLVFGAIYVIRLVKEQRLTGTANSPVGTIDTPPGIVAQSVLPDPDLEASITNTEQPRAQSKHELHRQERASAQQEKEAWRYARAVEKAKTPIVKGPGAATGGAAFGLILLIGAAGLAMQRGLIGAPALLANPVVGIGAVLAVLGAVIVVSGFRGRRGGFLNLLSILALLGIPAASFAVIGFFTSVDEAGAPSFSYAEPIVDGGITVADREQAERGFQIGFGDPVIDLSDLNLSDDDPITVPISLHAGDLTVIVPEDAAVAANIRLVAGEIRWEVDDADHETLSQVGRGRTELQSAEVSDDSPELSLWINAGAGNVTIRETQR